MRAPVRWLAMLAVGVVVVSACGGGGGGTSSEPSQPASSVAASAAPSEGAASTEPSVAPSAASSAEPSTGGAAGGVCELVTASELDDIFGVSGITTRVLAGPPDTCDVQLDDAPIAALTFLTTDASFVFDAFAADPSSQDLSGIGDRAIYFPTNNIVAVLVGDGMVSVSAFATDRTPEQNVELMKAIAKVAASRM